MNAIQVLKDEHRNVERILNIIKAMDYKVLLDEKIDYDDFFIVIDCIRNYADGIHHKKEEDMLFKVMVNELPLAIKKTIESGMLVEHDQGRFFVMELEKAVNAYKDGDDKKRLEIISNSMGYVSLLERHINKEDNVVFKFGENNLSKESIEKLNKEFSEVMLSQDSKKYIDKIELLEKKYLA